MILKKELLEIEQFIKQSHETNTKISTKGIDWHLDHSLKVMIGVSKTLKKSNPADYNKNFNLKRSIIFAMNKIPRGKGRAPKRVLPPEVITKNDLHVELNETKKLFNEIENLPENSNFKHPYFGMLNLKQTKKFLRLHTNHHLKICRDIVNKKNQISTKVK